MLCVLCGSDNQREFSAEINVHLDGMHNLGTPSIFLFPKIVVCLICGCSHFITPEPELARLASGSTMNQPETVDGAANRFVRTFYAG
jgi:hypothetical protein